MMFVKFFVAVVVCLLLSACSSIVKYAPEARPKQEQVTRAGNKSPYTVFGKTYYVMASAKNYREAGIASWYGKKFHGRPTAIGEKYNMYLVSAAHKSLPIPSYAKVTNLNNNRSLIVRINDRGPFHGDRLIDLSYAAAVKLGYAEQGTTQVLIEAIDTNNNDLVVAKVAAPLIVDQTILVAPNANGDGEPIRVDVSEIETNATILEPLKKNTAASRKPQRFLQLGLFSQRASAEALRARLMTLLDVPVILNTIDNEGNFLVAAGPISSDDLLARTRAVLLFEGLHDAFVVYGLE